MRKARERVNVPLFVLSLVLSLLLWAIVYAQTTTFVDTTLQIPLSVSNLDQDRYSIVTPIDTINVHFYGTSAQIRDLQDLQDKKKIAAMVSIAKPAPGPRNYQVRIFPSKADELKSDADLTVRLDVQPLTEKTMTVVATTVGELADPTHVYMDCVISPKTVKIKATTEEWQRISTARVELDLRKVDSTKPEPVNARVYLYDNDGRRLNDVEQMTPFAVDLTPILSPSTVKKSVFLNVPFKGSPAPGFVDTGFTVSPNQVMITGAPDVVNSLSQLDTDAIDLSGFDGDRTVKVAVHLPHGVSVAAPSQVQVKVSVRKSGGSSGNGQ